MKKRLFILVVILLLGMVSCETAPVAEEQSSITVETKTIETGVAGQEMGMTYEDMEAFLADWPQCGQSAGNSSAELNGTGNEDILFIPNLLSSDFKLLYIWVNDYNYFFYYMPVDYSKRNFDYDQGIEVSFSKESVSFAAVMEQLDLTPVNGIAYDSSRNTWFIDKDGRCLDIAFPQSLPVTTEEELYSYFEFEEYTVSGNSGEAQ